MLMDFLGMQVRKHAVSDIFEDQRLASDRKSTRLNSSHVRISYAVFCLKKKKKNISNPLSENPQPLPRLPSSTPSSIFSVPTNCAAPSLPIPPRTHTYHFPSTIQSTYPW